MTTPRNQQVYHVFLASPGDMEDERQIVRQFFERYNRNIANRSDLEFKVVDWEHNSNAGVGRTQALITEQTLDEYRNSLVLVIGLLGQRFGTPTAGFESGTEEELETVIKFRQEQGDWPEIKWFFRKSWGKGGLTTDPDELLKASQQASKVQAFKNRLTTGKLKLYTKDFPGTDDFEAIFRQDIELWLHDPKRPWNQHKGHTVEASKHDSSMQDSPYFPIWQKLLARECAHLPLEILDARQGDQADPIKLPDIFVPLKAMAPAKKRERRNTSEATMARALTADERSERVPVLDLLSQHRLAVLIGDPGSGKSALVNQLTWSLLEPRGQRTLPEPLAGCLPVRVVLRRVQIPAVAEQGRASWLWQCLESDMCEQLETSQQAGKHAGAVLTTLQQRLNQNRNGLILLDGLDEVPVADERRLHLLQAIQELVDTLPEQTRFIVTARPYAYADPRWQLKAFTSFILTPFDKEQRARFIQSWYEAARGRYLLKEAELNQRIPDLIERVEHQPHLRELAERPLLLTLISTLHASGGRLPEDRAQLYKDSVQLLLYRWRQQAFRDSDGEPLRLDENVLLRCLQHLAYQGHATQRLQPENTHPPDISESALLSAFAPVLKKLGSEDLLAFLQQHTGILIARAQDRFAFPHRSFQEYLAMGWLNAQTDLSFRDTVREDPLWWREVFLLAIIEQQNNPRAAAHCIRELLDDSDELTIDGRQRLQILCGLALAELKQSPSDDLNRKIQQAMLAIISDVNALNISERAEAGRVLGYLGDPRKGVGLNDQGSPDIDWVEIPAGRIMLEDKAGTFRVERFYMARYPITNAQFQAFVQAKDGYANSQWWDGLAKRYEAPEPSRWAEANHPRETVSWYEAMAFCAWLSAKLGYAVTLPTEMQWQLAACSGVAENSYPWGKDYQSGYANIDETRSDAGPHYLPRTTAVGLYPQGQSRQGIFDLSGNVWEWCLNNFDAPTDLSPSGGVPRSLHGGAWFDSRVCARAGFRYNFEPDYRDYGIGFRVCCASPIVH